VASFQSLRAWRKAHELTLAVYRLTLRLPEEERYGLCSQMRRAASSAGANLAEGRERESDADFAYFVTMAAGSIAEVQNFLILARDLNYLSDEDLQPVLVLAAEALRVVRALRRSIRGDETKGA
jgi:four helix bundle protein